MTNPNNAIGTNAAYSGRTSVNAFNDDLAAYSRGILTGWNCQVDTGLIVLLGGGNSVRDVAIAEDNAGNKTTINNISLDEVPVTLDTAPGANSRIDLIVAYVDNPPQGSSSTADNPEACGIIPVAGTPAVDPQAPDDNAIRTAITADGASGTTAYYVILAKITVPTGTTDLTPSYIEQGDKAALNANQIADGSITSSKIDFTTLKVLFSNAEHIGTSVRTVASHTITDSGKYFIFLNADINMLGKNIGNGNLSIYQNNQNIQQVFFNNNSLDYFMGGIQLLTITECEAGDVISVKASSQQQEFAINVGGERTNLNLVRIG